MIYPSVNTLTSEPNPGSVLGEDPKWPGPRTLTTVDVGNLEWGGCNHIYFEGRYCYIFPTSTWWCIPLYSLSIRIWNSCERRWDDFQPFYYDLLFVLFGDNYSDSFKFEIVECLLIFYHSITLGQLISDISMWTSINVNVLNHIASHYLPSHRIIHQVVWWHKASYLITSEGCVSISWCSQ
jgi:hypothetical protein